ncbi:hypothetical protein ADL28_21225 [Streptomyces violaceusniger]|uniref:Uncharacterized protein n=1 Tax=Streptomyces violaceusniger TaxID=68280 RepID=A0A0X3WIK4_STRVO|nr:hypothetical protein ADL28_21225 [Streptomyces violaceusniger]
MWPSSLILSDTVGGRDATATSIRSGAVTGRRRRWIAPFVQFPWLTSPLLVPGTWDRYRAIMQAATRPVPVEMSTDTPETPFQYGEAA